MAGVQLPAEILTYIFELLEDDSIFSPTLPTCMTESYWTKKQDQWSLINPKESMYSKQLQKYAILKSIIFTCKYWYKIGYHLLFRCIFLQDPTKLRGLCYTLDQHSSLGWYVKRIHVVRFYASASRRMTLTDVENGLISVIHQCPNLEIFTIDWPIAPSFRPIADALCSFSWKSLRSVHWSLTIASIPRLIWALDSLQNLVSAHLEFEPIPSDNLDRSIKLGAASRLALHLPSLEQLSLRGLSQDFLEEAAGWSLPALQSFSLDFVANRHDLPDILDFLEQHGAQLTFLDLNTIPAIDIAAILDLCPMLTTFSFNPDWRLPFHIEASNPLATPTLLHNPHPHITHIGLHQLLHAFMPKQLSGIAPHLSDVATILIQRTNDLTFSQLTRTFFPALKVIRVLNRVLLEGLEHNEGPDKESGCFARWERWHDQCARQGVRLEDCTGALMGDLPMDEEEEEWEEWEDDSALHPHNVGELRELLEECKRMTTEDPVSQPVVH